MIQENAYAKINLFLHCVGRRSDGYHLLQTLFAFVSVCDRIGYKDDGASLSLEISGPFANKLEAAGDNLVIRAAHALAEATGQAVRGRLMLEKLLPVAAGLGGGSADAAACLRLLNRAWGIDWPLDRLEPVASVLGADVPACLYNRAALGEGIGDLLRPWACPRWHTLLVNPGRALLTAEVFACYQSNGTYTKVQDYDLQQQVSLDILSCTGNDLQDPACAKLDAVRDILEELGRGDPLLYRMSGSGPSCFALYEDEQSCMKAKQEIRTNNPDWWVAHGKLL